MGGDAGVLPFSLRLVSILSCRWAFREMPIPKGICSVKWRTVMLHKRQNGGVECLRVLMMFGITLLHQLGEFGVGQGFLSLFR